ncbi:MAG: glycosyltransferase, partial [Phycisphaerales bacterium]
IAECVANAPGGPIHVLISDRQAEHVPGCNMAFRKSYLEAIGGFDHQFRVAGDDVDVCWRMLEKGWTLGFSPAALVWHHRRNSIRAYWRQQVGYGKAEALLERKWPEKYNPLGHATWSGQIYNGPSLKNLRLRRSRIYHGTWGAAPFQRLYQPQASVLAGLHTLPEWYLCSLVLGILSAAGLIWTVLLAFLPLFILSLLITIVQAIVCARKATYPSVPESRRVPKRLWAITTFLHLMQPVARLWGRLKHGLVPWRNLGWRWLRFPVKHKASLWSESWKSPEQWLQSLEAAIKHQGAVVQRGGDFDSWDLKVRGGLFCSMRIRMAIEEHGGGKQLARFKAAVRFSVVGVLLTLICAGLSVWAFLEGQWLATGMIGAGAVIFIAWILAEIGGARASIGTAIGGLSSNENQSD